YTDAKSLFAAIQTRFGGNEATKKTQKTLLKQMYENFSASNTESLDFIFNRLQKIVSQLAILDTIIFDDLYNNFKIVKQEVKVTANSSSSSNSQNMDFVSSPSSTNEVNTAYRVSTANTQANPTSTQVNTASTQVSTANLSDANVYAFLASQPNGSQLAHEDLVQIHKDDLEEIDLKWQLALLSMRTRRFFQKTSRKITINGNDTTGYDKSKVKCFNCHKLGHFAREWRQPKNQDSRNWNQDNSRRTVNVEDTSSNEMVAIDGAGFDWSFMADDEVPTNMALMDFSESESCEIESKNASADIPNELKENLDASLVKDRVSDNKDCLVESLVVRVSGILIIGIKRLHDDIRVTAAQVTDIQKKDKIEDKTDKTENEMEKREKSKSTKVKVKDGTNRRNVKWANPYPFNGSGQPI
nr:hypothetical protein [Tanacetum cinerariifolium]